MKKLFLSIIISCLLLTMFAPGLIVTAEEGIVPCGNTAGDMCEIEDFFTMLNKIYEFIVKQIATPLAILALTIGGIMMLISAGNPNLMGTGKKIVFAAIIGLVLVWCSWLIIDFVLTAVGFTGDWSNTSIN